MRQIKIIVSGKVQGVSYRVYTREKAKELGLMGYVRNLTNGDVEIVATGETVVLEKLIDWAKSGSPSAIVQDLQTTIINPPENFTSFDIRY